MSLGENRTTKIWLPANVSYETHNSTQNDSALTFMTRLLKLCAQRAENTCIVTCRGNTVVPAVCYAKLNVNENVIMLIHRPLVEVMIRLLFILAVDAQFDCAA